MTKQVPKGVPVGPTKDHIIGEAWACVKDSIHAAKELCDNSMLVIVVLR